MLVVTVTALAVWIEPATDKVTATTPDKIQTPPDGNRFIARIISVPGPQSCQSKMLQPTKLCLRAVVQDRRTRDSLAVQNFQELLAPSIPQRELELMYKSVRAHASAQCRTCSARVGLKSKMYTNDANPPLRRMQLNCMLRAVFSSMLPA